MVALHVCQVWWTLAYTPLRTRRHKSRRTLCQGRSVRACVHSVGMLCGYMLNSSYFGLGLGLKNLVLFTSLQGLRAGRFAAPPQEPHPALGLRPRFSASFGSLFQQSSFPPMHSGLDKTLVIPIFRAKECIRIQDFVLKIYKKIPRVPVAEGETFVRTHPRAHLPDSGAPPNLLGWLRPYPSPIHESNGNHFSDRSILVGSNSLEWPWKVEREGYFFVGSP